MMDQEQNAREAIKEKLRHFFDGKRDTDLGGTIRDTFDGVTRNTAAADDVSFAEYQAFQPQDLTIFGHKDPLSVSAHYLRSYSIRDLKPEVLSGPDPPEGWLRATGEPALCHRTGGSQRPDKWLNWPRNNQSADAF